MPLRSHGNIIGSIDLPCLSRAVCNIGCMIYFYIGSLDADGAISHVSFNPATSAIEIRELASAPKPGFLHLSDDYVFTAEALRDDDGSQGFIGLYTRPQGQEEGLKFIGRQPAGKGGSSHVSATRDGSLAFIANYSGGSISMFVVGSDGALEQAGLIQHKGTGFDEKRQEAPHPHCVRLSPDERFLLVPDLGTDKVHVYELDREQRTLRLQNEWSCTPGGGPRHIAFHPNGKVAALARELDSHISLLDWDSHGGLKELAAYSTLPEGYSGQNAPSEIAFSPDGKHLYLANRGHNSLAIYEVSEDGGSLNLVGHESIAGDWPRHFAISPDGEWVIVANERSNSITIFQRDASTGRLQKRLVQENVLKPGCIAFE